MHESIKNYLSRRRSVESRQLANMQLASFDIEIQLTGCPKSSESSLFDMKKCFRCYFHFVERKV